MARMSLGDRKLSARVLYVGAPDTAYESNLSRLAEVDGARGPLREDVREGLTTKALEIAPRGFGKVQGCDLVLTLEAASLSAMDLLVGDVDGVVLVLDADDESAQERGQALLALKNALKKRSHCPVIVQLNRRSANASRRDVMLDGDGGWTQVDACLSSGDGVMETLHAAAKAVMNELAVPHKTDSQLPPPPKAGVIPPSVAAALRRKTGSGAPPSGSPRLAAGGPDTAAAVAALQESTEAKIAALTELLHTSTGALLEGWNKWQQTASTTLPDRADMEAQRQRTEKVLDRLGRLEQAIEKTAARQEALESKLEELGQVRMSLDEARATRNAHHEAFESSLARVSADLGKAMRVVDSASAANTLVEGTLQEIDGRLERQSASLARLTGYFDAHGAALADAANASATMTKSVDACLNQTKRLPSVIKTEADELWARIAAIANGLERSVAQVHARTSSSHELFEAYIEEQKTRKKGWFG